jgi:hypothetical protein
VALNPAQQELLDSLGAVERERPTFEPWLRDELRQLLEDGLRLALGGTAGGGTADGGTADGGTAAGDDDVWVNKHTLAAVHGCEARWLAEEAEPFEWTVPAARGSVAHKAIELSIHLRTELTPVELVDEALARLEEGTDSVARFLQGCSEIDRAELRAEAADRVSKFLECWPPLEKRWRPVTESRLRAELLDQRVVLQGKVDLTLGQPKGTTAGKVIVDLKTGGFSLAHHDDLRFYALVETIRLGTPPRRVASYYLDSGTIRAEDVTVGVLHSAARRVVDGVTTMVELRRGERLPEQRPGPLCRWCTLAATCEPGRAWLAAQDDWG